MGAEFDRYAADYAKLSTHPLRDAMGTSFLHERKWTLLQSFYRKAGLSRAESQRWRSTLWLWQG